MLEAVLKSM